MCHDAEPWAFHGSTVIFRRIRKIWKKSLSSPPCLSVCLAVRPSVRMEEPGSQWTDIHDISYLRKVRPRTGDEGSEWE